MVYLIKISFNFAAEKPEHEKVLFLADVQKFRYNVFDGLFLSRIGRIRALMLPGFEGHITKSHKKTSQNGPIHKKNYSLKYSNLKSFTNAYLLAVLQKNKHLYQELDTFQLVNPTKPEIKKKIP